MLKRPVTLLVLATLMSSASFMSARTKDEDTLKLVSGYRQWTRVTEKPIAIEVSSFAG